MKNTFFALTLLSLAALTTACDRGEKGVGDYVRETRTLSGFSGIDMRLSGQVEVYKGTEFKVEVEAQSNLLDEIEMDVEGGRLKISLDDNIGKHKDFRFYITMPDLNEVELSGSGNVNVRDPFSPARLNVRLSGSGNIAGSFTTPLVEAVLSGSGNTDLRGSTDRLNVRLTGSGSLNALDMPARVADLTVSGSGSISATVNEELSATISGSGNIRYRGNPQLKDINQSGSGKLTKI